MTDNETKVQDVEPPKYAVQSFGNTEYISTGTGTLNGIILDYEFKTKGITDKKYPHDEIVTFQDLNNGNTSGTFKIIEGNFNELYVVGLKPITFESSQPYIEHENNNHFDFMFMVLLPFLVLVLILRLRSKNKKK